MAELFRPIPLHYQPKIDNLFIVEFPEYFNMPPYFIQGVTKPKLEKGKWSNITVETLDPIYPSMTSSVVDLIHFCELNKPSFFSKKRNLFSFSIKALDPTGLEVEEWIIDVKQLVSVDFGDFSYADKEFQKIKLIFKPSDCRLNQK